MQAGFFRGHTAINIFKTAAVITAAAGVYCLWGNVVAETAKIFFGACIIAFLLVPISRLLEKRLKRPLAAAITVVGVFLLLLGGFTLLLPVFIRQFSGMLDSLPEAISRIRTLAEGMIKQLQGSFPETPLPSLGLSSLESSASVLFKNAAEAISSIASGFYKLFLMAALSCFLLSDRERILLRAELLIPSAWRSLAVRAGNTLSRELRLYLRGQATIALAVGTLASIGLAVIGVQSAPMLGAIVGVFNVIPYFGPLLGGVPAVLMALGSGWKSAAFTILILFLVQQIDGMVISPRVMGNITGFAPAIVLLALFAGARIGNIGGMLLALPVLLGIRTIYRVFVQRHEKN